MFHTNDSFLCATKFGKFERLYRALTCATVGYLLSSFTPSSTFRKIEEKNFSCPLPFFRFNVSTELLTGSKSSYFNLRYVTKEISQKEDANQPIKTIKLLCSNRRIN